MQAVTHTGGHTILSYLKSVRLSNQPFAIRTFLLCKGFFNVKRPCKHRVRVNAHPGPGRESRPKPIVLVSGRSSADFIGVSLTKENGGQAVTKAEEENQLINLEDISSQVDAVNVKFVYGKYGANSFSTLLTQTTN